MTILSRGTFHSEAGSTRRGNATSERRTRQNIRTVKIAVWSSTTVMQKDVRRRRRSLDGRCDAARFDDAEVPRRRDGVGGRPAPPPPPRGPPPHPPRPDPPHRR